MATRLAALSITCANASTPTSGQHQLFKHCCALDIGVPRSVVGRAASTQGAVQPEPVGRSRPNEAHANPAAHANGGDRDVFSCCPVLGDAHDRTLTVMHPSDQTGSTSVCDSVLTVPSVCGNLSPQSKSRPWTRVNNRLRRHGCPPPVIVIAICIRNMHNAGMEIEFAPPKQRRTCASTA